MNSFQKDHILIAGSVVLSTFFLIADYSYAAERQRLSINIDDSTPVASFMPDQAFGATLDGLEGGDLERIYSPGNIKAMSGAAYRRLAYRLRTELGIEAWHWNDNGSWSDEANKQGYWTSSDKAVRPSLKSFGYRLPRRGNTIDQAGNDGYSRLDDGNESTFWKSNPYLDSHFTGKDNSLHPQWVIVDFGKRRNVNALHILWGEPYATDFQVEYWDGKDTNYINDLSEGVWRVFDRGHIKDDKGGDVLLRLSDAPVSVRFVRILLNASSGTGPKTDDVRDRLGYSIRELFMGSLDKKGRLKDIIRHAASNKTQTFTLTSSTDPWHRAKDLNLKTVQPGFDQIIMSGLGKNNHILVPAAVLYDTPENMAAMIRYLKSRNFPISMLELGEEPDGQNVSPEHYAALYLQIAKVIHDIDPTLITGGPGFQSEVDGWNTFANPKGERSWMKRFLFYLRERKRLDDFAFFSFEWYPFDSVCESATDQLIMHPTLMKKAFERLDMEGVPRNIPWIITEYGYSSFAGRAEVELPAAILNAEIVSQFLMLGGQAAFYYGLEPNKPIRELDDCTKQDKLWGNLMMFEEGSDGEIKWRLPAYYGAKMVVEEWAEPVNKQHHLFRASVVEVDKSSNKIPNDVTVYAVLRPDRRWGVMILNKSADRIRLNQILFNGTYTDGNSLKGQIEVVQYSPRQYAWHADGENGHPLRSEPPEQFKLGDGLKSGIILPPLSITVVRCEGPHFPNPDYITTKVHN
ncbi:discoidin domain-containing protein [Desulforegula conservatrix]|uniref:discoidin domain-containing protein n=1 Tax=Desulforegula conservatrix TaxID=153026 RepID=UPI0018DB94C8|nr:discoidin domain-containing protein [Desulforegula conservatrix]